MKKREVLGSETLDGPVAARSIVLVALAFVFTGCAQLGPDLVKAGRNDYNMVLR